MKALKAFIKSFEVPQRSVKIKILVNFFFLSGIGTLRVKAAIKQPRHSPKHSLITITM